MGEQQSNAGGDNVGILQRSVLSPLLFAVYQQYTDDMQLHLTTCANIRWAVHSCRLYHGQWYLQNSLQLKSGQVRSSDH